MPNSFPGMNPYLESPSRWHSVHQRLAVYIADQLTAILPLNYVTRTEERVFLVPTRRAIYPDAFIARA